MPLAAVLLGAYEIVASRRVRHRSVVRESLDAGTMRKLAGKGIPA